MPHMQKHQNNKSVNNQASIIMPVVYPIKHKPHKTAETTSTVFAPSSRYSHGGQTQK